MMRAQTKWYAWRHAGRFRARVAGVIKQGVIVAGVGLWCRTAVASDQTVLAAESTAAPAVAEVSFDALFLRNTPYANVDVGRFGRGQAILPGVYQLSVYVNNRWRQDGSVQFAQSEASDTVVLCVTPALLRAWALTEGVLAQALAAIRQQGECGPLAERLPSVDYRLNLADLRLDVAIPQALLANLPDGYVRADEWAKGDVAAFVSYQANHYERRAEGQRWQDQALGIRAGLSAYGWTLRHNGYYTKGGNQPGRYRTDDWFLQTDVATLQAQVQVGTFYTAGDRLDGLKMKGLQLRSDERMLPAQWRGYAPVVRGVARTNAKVTIRQREQVIYETTVPAGAFAINDLYPLGNAGNLVVTVTEADGQQDTFTVPFSAGVLLLRPGFSSYSVALGQVSNDYGPPAWLWQGSWRYGVSDRITVNLAAQQHEQYRQGMLGVALSTALGAWSVDYGRNRSVYGLGQNEAGSVWQLNYAARANRSQTSVYASMARYSAQGSPRLDDFLRRQADARAHSQGRSFRPKRDWQVSLNQALPHEQWGYVYASGSQTVDWLPGQRQTSVQLGYSNHYQSVRYSVSASQSREEGRDARRRQLTLSLSLPLSSDRPQQTVRLSQTLRQAATPRRDTQLGYSDVAGPRQQFNYGATWLQQDRERAYSGYVAHQSSLGLLNLSAGKANRDRQGAVGLQGAIVAHPKGVLLTPRLGDSFVIVLAPGAGGAAIKNQPGTYLNAFGQGVVPYVRPYELNHVGIDPRGTDYRISLMQTEKRVVPRGSGVSVVRFATEVGWPTLFRVRLSDGGWVPAGAVALDAQAALVNLVGPGGRLFVPKTQPQGRLWLRWGDAATAQSCVLAYVATAPAAAMTLLRQDVVCTMLVEETE
ncbi:MAG: fimbrial biogenesis outer membrane usher protein [Neisseriaceae bacterium]|nr:fimbrial biogenesis outer membrane usher protein [Neisseriaceae bacterium]